MKDRIPLKTTGLPVVELVLAAGILGVLCAMAVTNFMNQRRQLHEHQLRNNLDELRRAVYHYYLDHNRYPCSSTDFNKQGDPEIFKRQLLWHTNEQGKPAKTKSKEYRFGPYLQIFPIEPITRFESIEIDTESANTLIELKTKVSDGFTSDGGWFYQASTGYVVANLGRRSFKKYYALY